MNPFEREITLHQHCLFKYKKKPSEEDSYEQNKNLTRKSLSIHKTEQDQILKSYWGRCLWNY